MKPNTMRNMMMKTKNGETKLKENERDEVSEPVDKTKHEPPPICLFCKKKGMTTDHWMSNCKKVKASSKTEIQQMGFCSLCLYLKRPYSQHWCKEYFGRNKLFCEKCVVHVSLCHSPSTHEKTCLPYSVAEKGYEDTGEEKLPVLTAQGLTLEEYDTADDEYDGYEDC